MSKKNTIYQDLGKFFNINTYNNSELTKNKKIVIKGDSIDDVRKKGLELQQKSELEKKFFKNIDHGFQKAMQYEAARLPAYLDYEGMEYYPIIASALDLYMEEATLMNQEGKMLNIYSNNQRIKEALQNLFFNIVNVDTNLPYWVRNVVKYGDNFVLSLGEKGKGITNVRQMVNYEIERTEKMEDGKPVVKFKNRTTGDIHNIFEVLHFRLLGDSKYLPYGGSILNKIRRVWRQLILAEDSMLTYRLIRSADRRVYRIDVGNMDVDDIEEYIYKVASTFKKTQRVNFNDGQIDYRFNILGNDEDIYLPVRNGNSQTGVDTLPGMQNVDDIHDIEYLRDNLLTGLGIPKPFLSFQDASGGGKNMAQHDIRFAKKIVRIQRAMLQELNKLAVMHLFYLGFSKEEVYDFTLSLNNPSTQEETLRIELMQAKTNLYTDLTRTEGGIAAMSHTNAKRLLYNMSDEEIMIDLKQQRIERAVSQELENTAQIIKRTGAFDEVDKVYSSKQPMSSPFEDTQKSSEEGEMGGGDEFQSPSDLPEPEGLGDSYVKKYENLLNELSKTNNIQKTNNYIFDKNKKLNDNAKKIINEINNQYPTDKNDVLDDLNIEDLENI